MNRMNLKDASKMELWISKLLVMLLGIFLLQSRGLAVESRQWTVPLAGNSYSTEPASGKGAARIGDRLLFENLSNGYSIYFHVDRSCDLTLELDGNFPEGTRMNCRASGSGQFNMDVPAVQNSVSLPMLKCTAPGYVQVDVTIAESKDVANVSLERFVVHSTDPDLELSFVKNNQGNMYYWGRRGPSVHLTYKLPPRQSIRYGYSELTLPKGQDVIGSYFMANGFAEGYFGIQVNSGSERRVLFSVWSPFSTDDPRQIPEDQRVALVSKGATTRVGEFGNEGSGGQSYVVYPWKSDTTYCFLTEVVPQDNGSTRYTSWFCEKGEKWSLVASFDRPKTSTHLRGYHSFLENFNPSTGHVSRSCLYGNVWVRDTDQRWHFCDQAKFTVDATGSGGYRLDFEGGTSSGNFFLRNCGFFSGSVKAGTLFQLEDTKSQPPVIDFEALQR